MKSSTSTQLDRYNQTTLPPKLTENLKLSFPSFSFLEKTSFETQTCFLGEIVKVTAPLLTIIDTEGIECVVAFNRDIEFGSFTSTSNTFSWADLKIGRSIAILNAIKGKIECEAQTGINISKSGLSSVYIFRASLLDLNNSIAKLKKKEECLLSYCNINNNTNCCGSCRVANL